MKKLNQYLILYKEQPYFSFGKTRGNALRNFAKQNKIKLVWDKENYEYKDIDICPVNGEKIVPVYDINKQIVRTVIENKIIVGECKND